MGTFGAKTEDGPEAWMVGSVTVTQGVCCHCPLRHSRQRDELSGGRSAGKQRSLARPLPPGTAGNDAERGRGPGAPGGTRRPRPGTPRVWSSVSRRRAQGGASPGRAEGGRGNGSAPSRRPGPCGSIAPPGLHVLASVPGLRERLSPALPGCPPAWRAGPAHTVSPGAAGRLARRRHTPRLGHAGPFPVRPWGTRYISNFNRSSDDQNTGGRGPLTRHADTHLRTERFLVAPRVPGSHSAGARAGPGPLPGGAVAGGFCPRRSSAPGG